MNIQDNRETANKAVREWKSHHQETYSDFKRQVAAIGSGDLSLMERTMGLLDDSMPQNARNFYAYIFKYITKVSHLLESPLNMGISKRGVI